MSNLLPPSPAGRPSSHSIRDARWLVVTTTSQAACSSPGSATIKAGSPQTRYASTSGTPCRTCSHTVPIRPCSSLICECLDQLLLFISYFLPFAIISIWSWLLIVCCPWLNVINIVPKGRFVMMSLLYDVLYVGCNTWTVGLALNVFQCHVISADRQNESWQSVRSKTVWGRSWCRKTSRMSPAKRWVGAADAGFDDAPNRWTWKFGSRGKS